MGMCFATIKMLSWRRKPFSQPEQRVGLGKGVEGNRIGGKGRAVKSWGGLLVFFGGVAF